MASGYSLFNHRLDDTLHIEKSTKTKHELIAKLKNIN